MKKEYEKFVASVQDRLTQARSFKGYGTPDAPFISGQAAALIWVLEQLNEPEPAFPRGENPQ